MESFDFSKDFEISFEAKKEYHIVITDSKVVYPESGGKRYIEHTILGGLGQKFRKRFYTDTEGGKRFYTRFLSSCGITKEETANWRPENLDGKFLTVEFVLQSYCPEVYNAATGEMEPGEEQHKFDLKSFRACSATQDMRDILIEMMNGESPF